MHKDSLMLITGGGGVLGAALQKKLQDNDVTFIAPRREELDLLNAEATGDYISKHKPDIVVHLAAMVFGLGGNLKNQMNSVVNNTIINNNLFSALYQNPPKKIFFAGTVASYPFPFKSLPLKEEDFFNGLPHYGEFGYAMAKRHAYTYLKILKEEKNTSFTYGVFTNLFGINDNFDIENSHVVPSLIAKAFRAKLDDKPLEVWGNGEAERDFLCSDDAARAICFLLDNESINDIINISSGKTYSIKYVAELIAKAYCMDKEIKFLPAMPSGILNRSVNNQKIIDMGFKLSIEFETAILNACDWYASIQSK